MDAPISEIACDHRQDRQVEAAFSRILADAGTIDVFVNNVWGGYERMVEDGTFTWPKPFWEQPLWRWDAMFSAGVRAHYQASQLAAPRMIAHRRGLIVNISFWSAQKYIGNVAYGVSKAATDKMTADMATELRPYGITVVSLYPGLVRTERVMEAAQWLDLTNSESPEFTGRAVVALAVRVRSSASIDSPATTDSSPSRFLIQVDPHARSTARPAAASSTRGPARARQRRPRDRPEPVQARCVRPVELRRRRLAHRSAPALRPPPAV